MCFLRWWRAWFVILYVLVQHFKNTSLPTNVYLDDFSPITASSRLTEQPETAGAAAGKQDVQLIQVPHLTGFHTNFWCMGCAWVSKHFLCAETMCRPTPQRYPFLCCLCPKHTTSSRLPPASLPLQWFTSSFTVSVTFYGDNVHTFFTLRTISPGLKFTEAQQEVRYQTKHFTYLFFTL